jgi:transcription elongation factor Elf1
VSEHDCAGTPEVVCPHCGHEHSDSYEWVRDAARPSYSVECESCERPFRFTVDYEISYSSYVPATHPPEPRDAE